MRYSIATSSRSWASTRQMPQTQKSPNVDRAGPAVVVEVAAAEPAAIRARVEWVSTRMAAQPEGFPAIRTPAARAVGGRWEVEVPQAVAAPSAAADLLAVVVPAERAVQLAPVVVRAAAAAIVVAATAAAQEPVEVEEPPPAVECPEVAEPPPSAEYTEAAESPPRAVAVVPADRLAAVERVAAVARRRQPAGRLPVVVLAPSATLPAQAKVSHYSYSRHLR